LNKKLNNKKGFSLLEILLVMGIVGILFAVILPRAWRARSDASYTLIRQAAVELGGWGLEWAERNLLAQEETDTCTLDDYLDTLVGYTGGEDETSANNNWVGTINDMTAGCRKPDTANKVTFTVADILPQENQPRNPFTGLVYLHSLQDGSKIEPGLLYLAVLTVDGYNNYSFVFTGAEATSATDWYAGMGDGLPVSFAGLRNGVFVARLKP
jgi:prepilin-type N-terminal cleavage/methylation domain-containing protein